MRKLISALLALVLVLSMATVAFAYEDKIDQAFTIDKDYEVKNGTAPAETFKYSFAPYSYQDPNTDTVYTADELPEGVNIPAIADTEVVFDANLVASETVYEASSAKISIDPDDYAIGVYTYTVTEADSTTAGVDPNEETLYLVLTILYNQTTDKHYVAAIHYQSLADKTKTEGFNNTYDAGTLTVKKLISGNAADMSKEFTFTITFNVEDGYNFNTDIMCVTEGTVVSKDATATEIEYVVKLGHDDSIEFTNIPQRTNYTVTEAEWNADGYTSEYTEGAEEGDIAGGDKDKVTITNTRTAGVDTGITMDSVPFVLMLAVCAIAAVMFVMKRRAVEF